MAVAGQAEALGKEARPSVDRKRWRLTGSMGES